jgi:HEPN domain-containing protein
MPQNSTLGYGKDGMEIQARRPRSVEDEQSMKITSVWEFLKAVEEQLPRRPGSSLYYRGHSNSEYCLKPSLFRHTRSLNGEHRLFREILNEEPQRFSGERNVFEKLARMQHYGTPTRLLDITRNPLVALYFTCVDHDDKTALEQDGEVVILSLAGRLIKYSDDDTVRVLSNLCKLTPKEKQFDTSLPLKEFNRTSNAKNLTEKIREEKPAFAGGINPRDLNSVLPVKAPKSHERICAQGGLFLLFGAGNGKTNVTVPDSWIVTTKSDERIIIDAKSKGRIRRQLLEINISKKTLLPD